MSAIKILLVYYAPIEYDRNKISVLDNKNKLFHYLETITVIEKSLLKISTPAIFASMKTHIIK